MTKTSKEKTNVIIFQQTHLSPDLHSKLEKAQSENDLSETDRRNFELVVQSQFAIAQELLKKEYAGCSVIVENADAWDKNSDLFKRLSIVVNRFFSTQLPSSAEELTFIQKKILAAYQGSAIAIIKNNLKSLSDDLTYTKVRDEILGDPVAFYANMDETKTIKTIQIDKIREFNTLKRASEAGNKVVILYGTLHNFTEVGKCFIDEMIIRIVPDPTRSVTLSSYQSERYQRLLPQVKVDCNQLTQGFSPLLTANSDQNTFANNNNVSPVYYVFGGFTVLALFTYGLFKHCKNTQMTQHKTNAPSHETSTTQKKKKKN